MKSTWILVCALLLAAAPLALCDNNSPQSVLAESTPASAASAGVPAGAVPLPGTLPAWIASTSVSHPVKTAGVPNFGKLNDHIWRSGQPSRQGYRLLASRGLKTVVNLREEFPQDKELIPPGVQYIYIPIKDEHAPTEEQAEQFMKAASDPANWPLLVHCHAGEGRAGTMAALVRCSLDNWDDSAVMKETNGFISAKVMGLIKPELAGGQRRLIQQWEAKAGAIHATAQRAAGVATVDAGGPAVTPTAVH
jgi:protein-tyrosine phosphatase